MPHGRSARLITQTVALTPGTRLGVYQITAPLGEGGMGQVWRATDTTLGRQVAIKILPDAFTSDPDRLARFEREARTLASLNHPHIAAIYGCEKSSPSTPSAGSGQAGLHALVMELVEGRARAGAASDSAACPGRRHTQAASRGGSGGRGRRTGQSACRTPPADPHRFPEPLRRAPQNRRGSAEIRRSARAAPSAAPEASRAPPVGS